jgi:hypothetical protein
MRIALKPGLPVVSRGPTTVQIGVDPRHGTVVDGITEADRHLLEELASGVDDSRLALPTDVHGALVPGLDRVLRARTLVGLLTDTGVLLRSRTGRAALTRLAELRGRLAPDAAAWSLVHPATGDGWELLARRKGFVVEIRGAGRTALLLAGALAAAGVGTVRGVGGERTTAADLAPGGALESDVGRPAGRVTARVVARALGRPLETTTDGPPDGTTDGVPEGAPGGPAPQPPDVVVLVDRAAADPAQGDRLLGADVPHLSIVVRETSVVVGPLVLPGRSPCLRCLDLHRTERDPQWPLVLAQLRSSPAHGRAPREETSLAQVAAGIATLQLLGHLDGRRPPAAVGATLEVELPDGLTCRRPWPAHPSCGCSWPPAPPVPAAAPARRRAEDGRPGPVTPTMLW